MSEFKRLYRLLQLINMLGKGDKRTAGQLARIFEVNERTIYRYFDLLRNCGFQIEKDRDHRYFLHTSGKLNQYTNDLIGFTLDEASLIRDALMSVHSTHPLRNNIFEKLFTFSELGLTADIITDQALAGRLNRLRKAMHNKQQVKLIQYHSANSQTIRDRVVEPIAFMHNLRYFTAFEAEAQQVRQFRPERCGEVALLPVDFQYEHLHKQSHPDAFGMNGEPVCRIRLALSPRGSSLLAEEFPLAKKDMKWDKNSGKATYEGEVKGFEGVGRFVLGLPGEVEVKGPGSFTGYLEHKRKEAISSS